MALRRIQQVNRRAILFAAGRVLSVGGLFAWAISRHGWPLNIFTWAVLAIALTLCAFLRHTRISECVYAGIVVFATYVTFPTAFLAFPMADVWGMFDDRGGREGLEVSYLLQFGHDGAKTRLLES
jgi:hypothetical protein